MHKLAEQTMIHKDTLKCIKINQSGTDVSYLMRKGVSHEPPQYNFVYGSDALKELQHGEPQHEI